MNNYWESIHGWFDYQKTYDKLVAEAADSDAIAEIGSWLGRSSLYMAAKIQESGKHIKFYTVDPYGDFTTVKGVSKWVDELIDNFGGDAIYEEFTKNVKRAGLKDFVTHLRLTSKEAAEKFEDGHFYAVFIDANHQYESALEDIKSWLPKVRTGGLICGHDYGGYWTGVTKAVKECFDKFECEGASVWVHRKT